MQNDSTEDKTFNTQVTGKKIITHAVLNENEY